jgi:hypothetical protein
MNYKTYPTDYVQQLNQTRGIKGRKKSRAFMEYWNDMEHGDHHSESFYAKSWEVSRSTAHEWIKEFMEESELFLSHWTLRNNQHYSYAKKQAEQKPSKSSSNKAQEIGVCENSAEQQPREDFNLSIVVGGDEDKTEFATDGEFNTYYSELRFIAGKYAGNKDEAYKSYLKVKEFLSMKILVSAYKQYVKSVDVYKQEKIQGFKKFIDGEMYLAFLPKKIKVISESGVFEGYYENESLKTADGRYFGISHSKYLEFLRNQKIEFLEVV